LPEEFVYAFHTIFIGNGKGKGKGKGKAVPLEAWTGPEGSRRLRFPDFNTFGPGRWKGCQP